MSISTRISDYLKSNDVNYNIIPHPHSFNSLSTAISANIPPSKVAKAVVIEDAHGQKLMAVLPANYKLSLAAINTQLQRNFHLIKEKSIYQMFSDCDKGAVPAVARPYNLDCICDKMLLNESSIYFEAGDHDNLVHLSKDDFVKLTKPIRQFRFSHLAYH